jgi:Gene product 88
MVFKGTPPKKLFSTNSKLKHDGIYSFGIPALKSVTGLVTCPAAGNCAKGCYARQGMYAFPSVKRAQEIRLAISQDRELFIAMADTEIRKRKIKMLRIHDSGDFYSWPYLTAWLMIIKLNPTVKFYAYTKRIDLFSGLQLPPNFIVIYSYGGKYDAMIKPSDRHSRVFNSLSELRLNGYSDVTKHDRKAIGKNRRIGLVYHGADSKRWDSSGSKRM